MRQEVFTGIVCEFVSLWLLGCEEAGAPSTFRWGYPTGVTFELLAGGFQITVTDTSGVSQHMGFSSFPYCSQILSLIHT
mgnify:CR=1 FL=1